MVANRGIGGYLQWMKVGKRSYAGSHANLLGQHGRLADEQLGTGKLVRRMIADKSSMLADPSFLDADLISHDDLMQIFLIADPSYLIESLTI